MKPLIITSVLFLILTIDPVRVFGQSEKLSEIIIDIAEDLASDDSDPESVTTYIEHLQDLAENPVRINSAGEEEITRLFFLTDFQVKALADYSHSTGKIISVFEIVNIPGFNKETVEMMLPFIRLDNNTRIYSDSVRWRNTLITNLSDRPSNDDTSSLGSSLKILSKYKFTAGSFSGGVSVEKDPGEKFLTGVPPLPDFFSANLAYTGNGAIHKIIIGDFSARFGLGTNINTGIRTGLSLTAPGYMSAKNEIRQYTSTDENNFFRGMAAEFSLGNLGVSLLYSRNLSDATIGSLSGFSMGYIESLYLSGLHSTSTLILKKDAVTDVTYGINLLYNFNNIKMGIALSEDRFSLPVIPAINKLEAVFDFTGEKNSIFSIYYNSLVKKILLYGELSTNESFRYAFVQGVSFRPSDRLTINFLYRNYEAGYVSFHGKGPGSSSTTGNEQGILGNFTFEAARHIFISAGCDIQNFSWLKYRCSSPSGGMKQEIRVKFLPAEKLTIEASFAYRLTMIDDAQTIGIPELTEIISRSIKGSARYYLNDNLTFGTRIDFKVVDPSGSRGMLLLQDIVYRFRHVPVTIWFRYCLFKTDDWDSRLYTYENDLLNSFSIPALAGEGSRSYLMAKWEINDKAEIRFKYGITSLKETSTTFENRNEIKFQLKVFF